MKISHKSKRFLAPHPQVAALISDILATPSDDLPAFLGAIDSWKWPRSDLNAWIKVLNKFDSALEDIIREYDVDGTQSKEFSSRAKETLCEILKFERQLLENTTNRKMFNSYDRLNSLLFTSDLDVLVATLLLLLRPSQQYSSQPALSHTLHISTSRLESLAKSSPALREQGIELIDLVGEKGLERIAALPQEASEVNFTFYSKGSPVDKDSDSPDAGIFEPQPSSSRAQPPVQSSAPHTIHLGPLALSSRTPMEIFADAVKSHQVPDNEKFELLCRIRSAWALGQGRHEERHKLAIVRLLAIAVYAHTHPEAQAQNAIFVYDTDLINRIAELLQSDRGISLMVQTAAVNALDALSRYRGKIQEIMTAVNAGVNHGILMTLFRKTVADITHAESATPNSFADALLSFVIFIASHSAGGNMVVGAGLIPLLIQIVGITHEQRLPIVSKTMQLLDNVLYGFMNAFTMFCNAHGVEALTDRIQHEVDLAINSHGNDEIAHSSTATHGLLQHHRAGVMKHILRSMHRMMQSSGTSEGMRGLIDSSLLKSVDKVIQYRGVFGPTVLPIAVNIVATFVHNEPTSLTAIQEAKLPETIYNALEAGIEPSFEVIQSIPNAIGALCLNQAGQDQLTAHPSIIPALFSIFTSERHLKVLLDKENAAAIGGSIDELIRHHPSLRTNVFNALVSTLRKIRDLGSTYTPPSDIRHWYTLSVVEPPQGCEIVPMEDIQTLLAPEESQHGNVPSGDDSSTDESQTKSHDNIVVNFIDAAARFLEGLFQHPPHCKEFITETDGLDCIAAILALPCLPYDFANSVYSDSLVQVIRTMAEVCPTETLSHLARQVKESLDDNEGFWRSLTGSSKLLPFVNISSEEEEVKANDFFRKMVVLHIRLTLLSDVYATAGYAHGRNAVGLLQNGSGASTVDIIPSLGALHRMCIWENIVLKAGLAASGIPTSPVSETLHEQAASDSEATTSGGNELHAQQPSNQPSIGTDMNSEGPKIEGNKELNATALKHIGSQIPNALGPFFQAVAKMLMYGRRNPDESQKKQAAAVSSVLADVMYKHLTEFRDGDKTTSYAYHTVMLGLITVLLFDDRTSQNSHHAVLLVQFRKLGGLDAVLSTTKQYVDAITRISSLKPSDRNENEKQEMVQSFGGLKMALHLLYSLISYKPSVDSAQIALFVSRDKPETHPDYYEPHDFLVKMRLAIAPLIKEIWQSSWIVSAPPAVSKYVIQGVQEIIAGENEIARTEMNAEPVSSPGFLRTSGPDEDRVRQLMDMGFARASAVRALIRTHNNVNYATEYLLSHPHELVTQEAPAAPANGPPEANNEGEQETAELHAAATDNDAPAPMETDGIPAERGGEADPMEPSYQSEKTAEERRIELDDLRKLLTADIGPLALRLVDAHPSLIFDVRNAFVGPSDGYQAEAIRCVVSDIEKFSPSAYDVQEDPLAVRCRLLALVLSDTPRTVVEVTAEKDTSLMDLLHALLLSHPIGLDREQSLPKWLPALLLAMESLLVLAEEPRAVPLVLPGQEVTSPGLLSGPSYSEARATLFELCVRLLGNPTLPRDELLATLRMLVLLSRDRQISESLIQRGGISQLLHLLKGPTGDAAVSGFQSHIVAILRHLVEDKSILEAIMSQEVKRMFTGSRNRPIDVLSFVRNSASMAARDPELFVSVTRSLCTLQRPDVPNHQIVLNPGEPKDSQASTTFQVMETGGIIDQMQIDEAPPVLTSSQSDSLESVIHLLLGELMRVGRTASDSLRTESLESGSSEKSVGKSSEVIAPSSLQQNGTPDHSIPSDSPPERDVQSAVHGHSQDDHYYACFLMQCLSELLFSYEQCKIAFLSYPRKRGQTPAKDPFSRSKSAALNFLLTELVSFGAFNVEPKFDARKRIILCNWAMSVIVALCVDCTARSDASTTASDLIAVRKLVLESVSKSMKDGPSNEQVDARYGRLLALADLCHRLLTVRFNTGTSKAAEETPLQLAKIMLEKNYVATLTGVLSDVDLNYPNMRSLVASILRPLEFLTKVAIKMGRAADKHKEGQDKPDIESTVSSEGEDEDDDDDDEVEIGEGREETPDLYRNSSLGMYGGEMEDGHYDDDAMDEDEDDDDEDIDVEYDEDTGSDDSSNTEEDDIIDENDIAEEVDGPPDGWQDVEDEMEEDEGDDDDDTGDDLEDEGGADDDEIMWQDVGDGSDNNGDDLADEGEDEDDMAAGVVDGDDPEVDDEAAEDFSTPEDLADELGELEERDRLVQEIDDPFGFMRPAARGTHIRSRFYFTGSNSQGRDADADSQLFGRPRHTGISAEAMSHPLLVDGNGAPTPTTQARLQRRPRSSGIPGNPHSDILHTIEELVGGEAMQLVQQLMTRTGLSGTIGADIRVEVPPPTGMLVNSDRIHRTGRTGIAASVRLRDPRTGESRSENSEFGPLPTLQRWQEEAKITHGRHLQERVQRLCNHIVLALLPDAREVARKAKEKEEQEKVEREAAEKAAAAGEAVEKAAAEKEAAEKEAAEKEAAAREMAPTEGTASTPGPSQALQTDDVPSGVDEANQESITVAQQGSTSDAFPMSATGEDAEMLDMTALTAPTADGQSESDGSHAVTGTADQEEVGIPVSVVATTLDQADESTSVAGGPSDAAQRVTVTIHGNVVDITDTGIDPTFLEALPDDMREEVLNQHFRDQRTSRVEQPAESQISPEFLDALPPEIRAEILQQERLERSVRERQQQVGDQPNAGGPSELDAADFIASLDPQLRQVVLLDSDEALLQQLPSHMIAEAGIIREGGPHIHHGRRETIAARAPPPSSSPRKVPQSRDAIQLLDRPGIAALVRLLFFPQLTKKSTLHKVLLNLCENSKSRTDLFNLLLSILQDGSGDLALVDKTFSQLSFKSPKTMPQSAKNIAKQKDTSLSMLSPIVPSDIPPDVVAQRCLDALSFIVETNELSSLFFLTEHELPAGLKKASAKKGKGKEKQAPQSHFPIVLLLGLLDRQNLVKTPLILDSVASLLDSVTRPLTSLKDNPDKKESIDQATATETLPPGQQLPNLPAQSTADTTAASAPTSTTAAPDAPQHNLPSVESVEEKILLSNPPQIPHPSLRLIVNILTVGECSGRTFQHTLALIQHLTYLPDARDVIAQELKTRAQEFGQNLLADLNALISALISDERGDLPSSVASKFSPASSDQAKLLRVLKTIDYMYSKLSSNTALSQAQDASDNRSAREIYETFRFTPLWRKLGDCLAVVESKSDMEHVATILLPLIESLMVVCKNVGVKPLAVQPATNLGSPTSPLAPVEESVDDLFVSFTTDHRKILNLMVRNNPSLMSGSFSLLVQNSRVLDFDNKRNYFNQQLHRKSHPREHYGTVQLNVRRARVFEDSYHAFQAKTGDQIKFGKLSVRFYGEEGVDAGGVTREWFQILARQMFDPNYALFEPCAADKQTYQPNRASMINPDHLLYFKFVGRVIGKAIYDGRLMDAHFARSLYRQLLGKPVDYRDVEWVDPEYYKSLCWILENDPTMLDLTFITEVDEFGEHKIIPLKENGASILVTLENRKEYVQLSAQYRLISSIKDQIEALMSGFYEIIPKDLISIFNEQEVELLISGTPDIDVDEWRAATEYNGYTSSDPVIVWWWRALKSFNRDERAKVLSFATGTSRVPLGGFVELQGVQGVQRFSIHRAYGDPDRLPQAHTCFNQIDLPQYSSYEKLRQQVLLAINEGGEGFGFA